MARKVSEGLAPDGRQKKADIDTMHAYRDAIRDEQGRRVVEYAAILYPGDEVRFDVGLEALKSHQLAGVRKKRSSSEITP